MGYHDQREIPNYWAYARNYVLQDHMFEPNASWSLPAHLFMVSEWSALCSTPGDPSSCVSNIQDPGLPADFGPAPHTQPDYAWTDLTYLLHRSNVSWAYYLRKGPEPDCEDAEMFCSYKEQDARTPGIWNPLPSFDTVREDRQLGDIRDTSSLFTALRTNRLPAGLLGRSQRDRLRAPDVVDRRRADLRHPPDQRDRPQPRLEEHGDLPGLGRLGRVLRQRPAAGHRPQRLRLPRPRSGHQPLRAPPRGRPPAAQLRRLREVHRGRLPATTSG